MALWVDVKNGAYGSEAQTTPKNGDPDAEKLPLDSTLTIAVQNGTVTAPTTFGDLPAIVFQPDGTVDENSPQILQLTDSAGISIWLVESASRTGYEVWNTKP